MIMVSVANIVNTSIAQLKDKMEERLTDIEQKIELLATEVFDLTQSHNDRERLPPSIKTNPADIDPPCAAKNKEIDNAMFPTFPLRSVEKIKEFNERLKDAKYYAAAVEHISAELKAHKDSKKLYTRRLHLKSMLFSE